ncbi:MAG: response regulator [Elainellaceae cyanobacterium]
MSKLILVVDDEERIREVVRACLEELAGWSVITAESAETALSKAKTTSPNAILLDISMPDIDGLTLCRQLQADPVTRPVPIILLTAKVLSMNTAELACLGVMTVIMKPFDPIQICVQIAESLGWEVNLNL